MHNLKNFSKIICLSSPSDYDVHMIGKFRGINPLVLCENELMRLTEWDIEFKKEFEKISETIAQGWYIKCLNLQNL